jgi:uncharacterized protein YdaU (DUF1376 family)
MKYYAHNIGDWLPATVHLSNTQEGVYRRLMDWYYSNELPLPLTFAESNKIVRARNQGDRDAVKLIVARYFTLAEDGWHHHRIDRDLESYAQSEPMRTAKRDATADRQRRARLKRDASWAALVSMGVQAPFKATQGQLDELLLKHGITQVVTRDAPRDLPGTRSINNHEPGIKEAPAFAAAPRGAGAHEGSVAVVEMSPEPSRVGTAAKALKTAGFNMALANTADPRFLALIQAGVTDDELRLTASEAVARTKSWGWLIATIAGRHADVANGFAPSRAAMGPRGRDHDRVAGLTPTIAAKRQGSA